MSITSFSYTGSQEDRSRKTEEEKMSDTKDLNEEQTEAIDSAIATALGDAYDCTRHWSAWSYGTMGPDDFSLVADDEGRIAEIREAVLEVVQTWRSSTSPTNAFALSFRFCPRCGKDLKDMPIHTCTPPREKGGA